MSLRLILFFFSTGEREQLHKKTFRKWINSKLAMVSQSRNLWFLKDRSSSDRVRSFSGAIMLLTFVLDLLVQFLIVQTSG